METLVLPTGRSFSFLLGLREATYFTTWPWFQFFFRPADFLTRPTGFLDPNHGFSRHDPRVFLVQTLEFSRPDPRGFLDPTLGFLQRVASHSTCILSCSTVPADGLRDCLALLGHLRWLDRASFCNRSWVLDILAVWQIRYLLPFALLVGNINSLGVLILLVVAACTLNRHLTHPGLEFPPATDWRGRPQPQHCPLLQSGVEMAPSGGVSGRFRTQRFSSPLCQWLRLKDKRTD